VVSLRDNLLKEVGGLARPPPAQPDHHKSLAVLYINFTSFLSTLFSISYLNLIILLAVYTFISHTSDITNQVKADRRGASAGADRLIGESRNFILDRLLSY
jgi:hypothetical protein